MHTFFLYIAHALKGFQELPNLVELFWVPNNHTDFYFSIKLTMYTVLCIVESALSMASFNREHGHQAHKMLSVGYSQIHVMLCPLETESELVCNQYGFLRTCEHSTHQQPVCCLKGPEESPFVKTTEHHEGRAASELIQLQLIGTH